MPKNQTSPKKQVSLQTNKKTDDAINELKSVFGVRSVAETIRLAIVLGLQIARTQKDGIITLGNGTQIIISGGNHE